MNSVLLAIGLQAWAGDVPSDVNEAVKAKASLSLGWCLLHTYPAHVEYGVQLAPDGKVLQLTLETSADHEKWAACMRKTWDGHLVPPTGLEKNLWIKGSWSIRDPEQPNRFNYDAVVAIEAGCFQMGSNTGDPDEKPVREVCVDAFTMEAHEVTNDAYGTWMAKSPATAPHNCCDDTYDTWDGDRPRPEMLNRPVTNVTWDEAVAYCAGRKARLPTEAEWEYAARGGQDGLYPWGKKFPTSNIAAFGGEWPKSLVGVGSFEDNGYGLYDMAGGVWEWTQDLYQDTDKRVVRGGSWFNTDGRDLRVSNRFALEPGPSKALRSVGFRCVQSNP